MKSKLIFSIVIALLLVLPLTAACAKEAAAPSPQAEEPKGEIVIGMLEDLSGPLAGGSNAWVGGISDCLRYINEKKNGILGHPIKNIVVDHKMDSSLVISGWERLKGENAAIITSYGAAAIPIIYSACQDDHIPVIAASGGPDHIYPREPSYYFSWNGLIYYTNAAVALNFAEKDWAKRGKAGLPKVAVDVIEFGTAGKSLTKGAKMAIKEKGWDYIITNSPLVPVDVTTQVLQMREFNPDYVHLAGTEQASIAYIKEFERQNIHPFIVSGIALGNLNVQQALGEAVVGKVNVATNPQWWDTDVAGVALAHELNAKWHPDVKMQPNEYFFGFFAFHIMAEALERAIEKVSYENLDGDAIKEAMETIDLEPMGLGTNFIWTPTCHGGITGFLTYQWTEQGTMERVADWQIFDYQIPEEQRTRAW